MTVFDDNEQIKEPCAEEIPEQKVTQADLRSTKRVRAPQDRYAFPDRLPPNSNEADQGVVACVLLSPMESMPQAIEILKNGPEEFYDLRCQTIYEVCLEMFEARQPMDLLTIRQKLKDKNLLEQIGGDSFLSMLPDAAPSAANLSYYADIVHEKYILRRAITVCTDVIGRIYEYEGEVDALMDGIERDILRIAEARVSTKLVPVKQLVVEAIREIEDLNNRKIGTTGIETGFIDLDKMCDGMHQGEVIVLAARPSMGKTSLGMNIIEHVCVDMKIPSAVFSMEMTARQLISRGLCSRARVNMRNIREGFLAERDYPKLTGAAGKIASAPLYIDDTSGLSVLQLRAKSRRLVQQYGVKFIVVDYIGLMNALGGKRRFEGRQQEIADISSGIKSMAKELDLPVLVLCQLNRNLDRDKNRKPVLADLRESGAIEQDADTVWLLYKPGAKEDEAENEYAIPINLSVAKQRNGPTGDVCLTFLKHYTRFETAAKVSDEEQQELT